MKQKTKFWTGAVFSILVVGSVFGFLSCTDPLPPRINPYGYLKTNWAFDPYILKVDTLEKSTTDPTPITIIPYVVSLWDEWIVDTTDVEVHLKITLLNEPEVSQEFVIRDTTQVPQTILPGDSLWASFSWNLRLNGQPVYKYLPPGKPNFALDRLEYQIARIRLEGTIKLLKNILPQPLPTREIYIFFVRYGLG